MSAAVIPKRVANVIIGRKLAALRTSLKMSQTDAGKFIHCTQSKIGNLERGDSGASLPDLKVLLDGYGADSATQERLLELAVNREKRASRDSLVVQFDGTMREVVALEASAHHLWQHNSMTIPGVLQTEAYMRNLFRAARPSMSADQIEEAIVLRLRRQAILDNTAQHFWFVIDQAALARMTNMDGDSTIERAQREALADAIDRPNVEIQIVPWTVGFYLGQESNFTIFRYDSDPVVDMIHVEGLLDGHVTSSEEEACDYLTVWEHQKAAAWGPEQSRAFLLV
ncbi:MULTISPECIES: helix-turn-helix transcriptional regulator [Actinosynnema]|uniref:helix-turn-helix domain-containing protein n=1 Tax=Actinosynnema TaxID=40566 RepID=UPI0020A5AF48|nr:helix-turn-helix transcriptional regulator [Actinosynnema pretiosum]MCP2095579.1 Helix-turn-helix domain-containing protein [Actinosynnema pretiosum]